jgi:hypothetical protein
MTLFEFYIDQAGELDVLEHMLCGDDEQSGIDRAGQYGIPYDIAAKVRPDQPCRELAGYLSDSYRGLDRELKQSLSFHKNFWDKNSDFYRKKFEAILGRAMPQYTVRLNVHADGISNWHGTDISINAFTYLRPFKEGEMIRDIIWVSMQSRTFIEIRKTRDVSAMNDRNVWGLTELAAVAIYQTDFCKSDWPIGYRELQSRQSHVKKLYAERKDFQEFLESAFEYFKNDPI